MSHDPGFKSGEEKLIYMANQIADTFQAMQPHDAVNETADHINKFWEPRMRRHLFEIIERGGQGLKPLVLEAAPKVKRPREEAGV